MRELIVRQCGGEGGVFALKSFDKLEKGCEKVNHYFKRHFKHTWKFSKSFIDNIDSYTVIVVDVIPDASGDLAMHDEHMQTDPFGKKEMVSTMMDNQIMGVYVGFFNKVDRKMVSANFYQTNFIKSLADEYDADFASKVFPQMNTKQLDAMPSECSMVLNQPYKVNKFLSKAGYGTEEVRHEDFLNFYKEKKENLIYINDNILRNNNRAVSD